MKKQLLVMLLSAHALVATNVEVTIEFDGKQYKMFEQFSSEAICILEQDDLEIRLFCNNERQDSVYVTVDIEKNKSLIAQPSLRSKIGDEAQLDLHNLSVHVRTY